MQSSVDDKTLRSISKEIGDDEWRTLATYLGFTSQSEIKQIVSDYREFGMKEVVFQMLVKWRQRQDKDGDVIRTLCDALESSDRNDLSSILKETAGRGEHFNLDVCHKEFIRYYKDTMGQLPLIPWLKTDYSWMKDMFVDLTLEKNERKGAAVLQREIHSYEDILQLQRADHQQVRDIILSGVAGSGKTTIASKMAYDWSLQDPESPLSKFRLLVALNLRELESTSDLAEAIFDQILPKDIPVSRKGLEDYLKTHGHDVLMILDGVDELGSQLPTVGNIIDVIRRRILRDCTLIVTTRPHMVHTLSGLNPRFTHVKSKGFSDEAIMKYIKSFFQAEGDEVSQQLYQFLRRSKVHYELAQLPLMLLVMCLIWSDDRKLPDTLTGFFEKAVFFIINRHLEKSEQPGSYDEEMYWKKIRNDLVKDVGKVALEGLLLPGQKLVFERTEFGNDSAIENACKIGILSRERVRSKLRAVQKVTFIHKTFQEAFAGFHLASLADSDKSVFAQYRTQIEKENVYSLEYLLRFCSGASVEAARMLLKSLANDRKKFSQFLLMHLEAGSEELCTIAKPFLDHCFNFNFESSDFLNSAFKYLIDCACKSSTSCREKKESLLTVVKRLRLRGVTVKDWPVVTSILGNAVNVSDLNLSLRQSVAEEKNNQAQLAKVIRQMKSLKTLVIDDVTTKDWPLVTSILGNAVNVSNLRLSLRQSVAEEKTDQAQLAKVIPPMTSLQKLAIDDVTTKDWPLVTSILGNAVNVSDLSLSLRQSVAEEKTDQAQLAKVIPPMTSLQKLAIDDVTTKDWPLVTSILGNAVNVSDLSLSLRQSVAEEKTDQAQLVKVIRPMKSMQKLVIKRVALVDWPLVISILENAVNVTDLNLDVLEFIMERKTDLAQLADVIRPMTSLEKLAIRFFTVKDWPIVSSILKNAVNVSDLNLILRQTFWKENIDQAQLVEMIRPMTSLQKLAIDGVTVKILPAVASLLGNAMYVSDLHLSLENVETDQAQLVDAIRPMKSLDKLVIDGVPVKNLPVVVSFLSNVVDVSELDLSLEPGFAEENEKQAQLLSAIRLMKSLQKLSIGPKAIYRELFNCPAIVKGLCDSASTTSLQVLVSRNNRIPPEGDDTMMTMDGSLRDECHGGKFRGSDQQLRFLKICQSSTETFLSSTGKILSKAPHLQGVLLSGHDIGHVITEITEPLSQLKDLEELVLTRLGLTSAHIMLLLRDVLPSLVNLQALNLCNNLLSPEALLDVIQWSLSSSSLRVLKLPWCVKGKPPKEALELAAQCNLNDPPPEKVLVRKTECSLEFLDISGNYLGKHTSRLIELLSGIHTLKEVNMEFMGLTNSDAVKLAEALKDCHQLQVLNITSNDDVGYQGMEYLSRMLGDKPGIQSHAKDNTHWLRPNVDRP